MEVIQHSFTREQLITRDMPALAKNQAAVASGADLEATRKHPFAGTDARLLRSFASNFVTPAVEAAFLELTTGTPLKAP